MLEKKEYKIYRDGDYIVEISKSLRDSKYVDFCLSHIDYGIKSVMFSVETDFNDDVGLIDFIKSNIQNYKASYKEDYED